MDGPVRRTQLRGASDFRLHLPVRSQRHRLLPPESACPLSALTHFFMMAYWKHDCANPRMDSSVLYMAMPTPPLAGYSNTFHFCAFEPSFGVKVISRVPSLSVTKSVHLYWSPKAWRPMTIGDVQPGTMRGTFFMMMGWMRGRAASAHGAHRRSKCGENRCRLRHNAKSRTRRELWPEFFCSDLAEHSSVEDVTDGAVGRLPHLLEVELLDTLLIGGDGRALDGNVVLQGRLGGVDRHLNGEIGPTAKEGRTAISMVLSFSCKQIKGYPLPRRPAPPRPAPLVRPSPSAPDRWLRRGWAGRDRNT